jgi:hypothetical protein
MRSNWMTRPFTIKRYDALTIVPENPADEMLQSGGIFCLFGVPRLEVTTKERSLVIVLFGAY